MMMMKLIIVVGIITTYFLMHQSIGDLRHTCTDQQYDAAGVLENWRYTSDLYDCVDVNAD